MKKVLRFVANDGSDIAIEVIDNENTVRGNIPESRSILDNAQETFEKALKPLKEVSNTIIDCIKDISNTPNEIQVELGFKVTAKAGIIITSLDSEMHFKVCFKWLKQ